MIPLGTILVKNNYSVESGILFRKFKKVFPDMLCLCDCSSNVLWVLDDYLTDKELFIYQKDNPLKFTVVHSKDMSPFLYKEEK